MIIYVGQSIDGYIADKNGQVTFLEQFESITTSTNNNIKNSYQNFIKDINVIVQGKTTYNQVLTFDVGNPYKDFENYVITNHQVQDPTVTKFLTFDQFKTLNLENKKVWIVGGQQIFDLFIEHNLVTKIIIFQVPILLGNGIKFTTKQLSNLTLSTVEYDNEFIEYTYKVNQ